MRCITLAEKLREFGAECIFICRDNPGNLIDFIREKGFTTRVLPYSRAKQGRAEINADQLTSEEDGWHGTDLLTDAHQTLEAIGGNRIDWLIVDHYAIDERWEIIVKSHCRKLMVIDDLANRPHQCELLLDQNLGRDPSDYIKLLPTWCAVLTGPSFALLQPSFSDLREASLARRKGSGLNRILISMGGVDASNSSCRVLESLKKCRLPAHVILTVVMGKHAPHHRQVMELAKSMPWCTEVLVNVSNMAALMAQCDLAIGAAGTTSWERCCLGLPTLLLVLADNQIPGANALHRSNSAILLSDFESLDEQLLHSLNLVSTPEVLKTMSDSSAHVTDGLGTSRVIENLIAYSAMG